MSTKGDDMAEEVKQGQTACGKPHGQRECGPCRGTGTVTEYRWCRCEVCVDYPTEWFVTAPAVAHMAGLACNGADVAWERDIAPGKTVVKVTTAPRPSDGELNRNASDDQRTETPSE